MARSRATKPTARRPKRTPQDVVLRITLEDIEPPIWREIALIDTTTLPELHRVIQLAFQWYDYHLHQFTIGADRYAIPDQELDDFGVPARSALGVTLSQLGLTEGAHFTYEYDFGDSWTHRIEVRTISPAADRAELMPAPLLVDGRRAAPPEDCGGPPGYDELLRVLADPSDPEHADMHTWVGPDFDGERFDARAARHALIMAAVWGGVRYANTARPLVALGDRDGALTWLERMVDDHATAPCCIAYDREWKPLRADPRFVALVREVHSPRK